VRSRRLFRIGGIVSGVVLVAFGIVVMVLALNGHSTVTDELKQQQITGSPDMTPTAIKAEAAKAGLKDVSLPTCDVAGEQIDTGSEARCFAQYMNIHALEATGGQHYSQMPRYATADGQGTNDEAKALKAPSGKPQENPARQVWVQETALATALNTSYMADEISLFGIVVGVALLLSGVGFAVLSIGGALRSGDSMKPVALGSEATPAPSGA
jgi:uncharacterized membrane protein